MNKTPTQSCLSNAESDDTQRRSNEKTFETSKASLKRRSFFSTIWYFVQFVTTKSISLVSNLILTRLLTPEIFGLIAIVAAIRQGILMFTDIGVRGKMIEDTRANEPFFYNTIWTYAFIRKWVLFAILCALAYPMSSVYGEPDLQWLIPIVSFTLAISSFQTTAMGLLSRNLELKKPVMVGVGLRIVTAVITIVWAWFDPSIRALVAGILFNATATMVASYFVIPGFRNRFCWYPEVMRSVVLYGRWVLVSTGARYFMAQGDRLLLGLFVLQSDLGIYATAVILADAGVGFVRSMANSLLQTVYARLSDVSTKRLQYRMQQIRWMILGIALPGMAFVSVFGSHIVALLYDPRYLEAGWMLQVLAVGGGVEILLLTSTNAMLSRGDSFRFMIFQTTRGALMLIGMIVGFYFGGLFGVLVGRVVAVFLSYPLAAWGLSHHGLWLRKQDLLAITVFFLLVILGLFALPMVPSPHELGL